MDKTEHIFLQEAWQEQPKRRVDISSVRILPSWILRNGSLIVTDQDCQGNAMVMKLLFQYLDSAQTKANNFYVAAKSKLYSINLWAICAFTANGFSINKGKPLPQ